jgi:hypothetical protein
MRTPIHRLLMLSVALVAVWSSVALGVLGLTGQLPDHPHAALSQPGGHR